MGTTKQQAGGRHVKEYGEGKWKEKKKREEGGLTNTY